MRRIIHIITGLGSGGAENMLYKLLKHSDKKKYYHEVISLIDGGVFGEKIASEGITLHLLDIKKNGVMRSLLKARNICKKFDVVDTWLYHADFFGFIIAKVLLNKKIIWNIRHSNLDKEVNKKMTLNIVRLNSFLSKYVDRITYNSIKAFETHNNFGYVDKKATIIPNGFELDHFEYKPNQRLKIREELSISPEKRVLITVGRWDIQKDYPTLLHALELLKSQGIDFKMIMVGTNLDPDNEELGYLINKHNLKDYLLLLGRRTEVPGLLSAADVYVSSSLGESFSNAIGEAMACELPCVVTDVGDSKLIVGDTGDVVMAKDYADLAVKLSFHLQNEKLKRNANARNKIIKEYDINILIKRIENEIWII